MEVVVEATDRNDRRVIGRLIGLRIKGRGRMRVRLGMDDPEQVQAVVACCLMLSLEGWVIQRDQDTEDDAGS